MLRLIKLAIYGLLGYAIYEFIRGATGGKSAAGLANAAKDAVKGASRELNRAVDTGSSRETLTGPGIGQEVRTAEPSGESVTHRVGRGVVHR